MATKTLREGIHESAEQNKSVLSEQQQEEVLRRVQLWREGKITMHKWQDVYKEMKNAGAKSSRNV